MNIFIMHVGSPGNIDIKYTVTRKRSIKEMVEKIPLSAPERAYFENDKELNSAFPNGEFNCWGVPSRAEPSFRKTNVGDLVLMIPEIGSSEDSGIQQIGIVKAKYNEKAIDASKVLWPDTPEARLYPFLFFFETEVVYRSWYDFLNDLDIESNWNPRGWYRKMADKRFSAWKGAQGYLDFLRQEGGR